MKIEYMLNKAQADELFEENAVLIGSSNAVFDYKIAELFGDDVCIWAESCMGAKRFLEPGNDWSSWGPCECNYFRRSGFNKIVSHHNYLAGVKQYRSSEGGAIWDNLWKARRERMEAAEAEEDRKREERKAKRAASHKAKQEAEA